MDPRSDRVAQVFIWKQGTVPDLDYARQVLSVVNPDAYKAILRENAPIHLFSVMGSWPDDFWPRALQDMRGIPEPRGTRWTDSTRYDLSGWQGTDTRTGEKLFVVTAFNRVATPETFKGEGVQAPSYASQPIPQIPYYPQYPTGPLVWPPQQIPGYNYPVYPGAPPGVYGQPAAVPYGYNPMVTGPLPALPPSLPVLIGGTDQPEGSAVPLPDSYAPFYVGFRERLAAFLIDFFFLSFIEAVTVGLLALIVLGRTRAEAADFLSWLGLYGPFVCLGLLVFMVYNIVGWSAYGRTIGKKLMGMRVVRADGSVPGFGRALVRMLGYFFSAAIAFLGFALIALDLRRQGLHDKLAETYVVPDAPTVPPPAGLPGYKVVAGLLSQSGAAPRQPQPGGVAVPSPALGLAAVSPTQSYEVVNVTTAPEAAQGRGTRPEQPSGEPIQPGRAQSGNALEGRVQTAHPNAETITNPRGLESISPPSTPLSPLGPATEALLEQAVRERPERHTDVEKARALYRAGMGELESGARQGYGGMEVEPGAARTAASLFREALDLVPTAVAYRYSYAVALRYSEGFEVAISEFRQVLELDPGHYEAQQQVALGPRWHDAFCYPTWGEPSPVDVGLPLPESVRLLLPQPHRPGTRLVLLREGSTKMVVALSRTRRDTWSHLPTPDMPARIELVLTRTPSGPIIAFYVVIRDDPDNPYKGETFLNPHDPGQPSDDACQLGQHMLAQLARQDHTYLIFVDENDHLLLSRRLVFDAATQVNIARVHYEVQTLPSMAMDPVRFSQAAQWHMDNFSLDQIKP